MRKGVREKTEVPVKILVNSTRETDILARENFYKNVPVKSDKCAWKNFIDLGKLDSYIQFHLGYLPTNILALGWESWEKIQNWGKN